MEKNTLWAIILSTVVLVVFFGIQAKFMPKQQPSQQTEQVSESTEVVSEKTDDQPAENELTATAENPLLQEFTSDAEQTEETFTITTNKVKATFTNRGGDIISYELLEHLDTDTGKGVEMADNVSSTNRAFAVSLGGSANLPLKASVRVESTVELPRQFDLDSIFMDVMRDPKAKAIMKPFVDQMMATFSPESSEAAGEAITEDMTMAMLQYMPLRGVLSFGVGEDTEKMMTEMLRKMNE